MTATVIFMFVLYAWFFFTAYLLVKNNENKNTIELLKKEVRHLNKALDAYIMHMEDLKNEMEDAYEEYTRLYDNTFEEEIKEGLKELERGEVVPYKED